ncbi:uncharacterized protein LOC143259621 isoform X5 [Megalopta genalis]|uniref:uncharacterized protein LOC143259621 isoform X5 n=1 Tax=Megalopta genalis TaxID=115081 RepID=UPI003FD2AE4D
MDTFRKNCAVYYSMLYYAGLWPYDHSIRAKVQRVAFIVLIISCIVCQILTLRNVEITLRNIVSMLSYTFLMLVYFFRYCGFIANFDLLKSFIEDIQNDFAILKNAAEIEIFKKQIRKSNRLTFLVLGYAIIVLLMYILFILIPTLLQSKYQVHYLRFIGYFYNERSRESDLVCVQIVVTGSLGILAIASTEATLGIYGFYLSALFQIVSYRIRKSVDDAATLITSSFVDIRPAVMMHQRAIKRAESVGTDMMISSLAALLTAVLSFAVDLYRAFLSITETSLLVEFLISTTMVTGHVLIIFIDNYTGQTLTDNSVVVFNETSICHKGIIQLSC